MSDEQKRKSDGTEADTVNEGSKSGSYAVGYCRPPDKHKFKPGQSGNPLGRPKRPNPLSFEPELADELYQSIAMTENSTITNKQAIAKTVVAAARKNAKQGMALMEYCAKLRHQAVNVSAADDDAFVEKLVSGESDGTQDNSSSAPSEKPEADNDK